ncbi:hypothetical protein SAMN03080601_02843 [Alkalitalea saponilacus]|uniref:Uncharacterized protein n=1 Tax=Alkalitalea saponilacus TaxID=889453 RepID=A0A1T5HSF8_9BACT|nr:hypothetical protein SAMN03080601_02843 [Alkalitalea saponilacus]
MPYVQFVNELKTERNNAKMNIQKNNINSKTTKPSTGERLIRTY